jgi:hypothetical protein
LEGVSHLNQSMDSAVWVPACAGTTAEARTIRRANHGIFAAIDGDLLAPTARIHLRLKANFCRRINSITPVQPSRENISVSFFRKL